MFDQPLTTFLDCNLASVSCLALTNAGAELLFRLFLTCNALKDPSEIANIRRTARKEHASHNFSRVKPYIASFRNSDRNTVTYRDAMSTSCLVRVNDLSREVACFSYSRLRSNDSAVSEVFSGCENDVCGILGLGHETVARD
eukprot:4522558-Amphidinium_carterae.1